MRRETKLTALLAVLLAALTIVAVARADEGKGKPSSPPGQGECQHGNSGKECRPDPQPDKGKECEEHGKKGGVNEDHCKGETPEPPTPPTPPTPPEPPTPPTPPTPPEQPPTPTPDPPVTTPETPTPPAQPEAKVEELEKALEKQAKANAKAEGKEYVAGAVGQGPKNPKATKADELPYTGVPVWLLAIIGGTTLGIGTLLRWFTR